MISQTESDMTCNVSTEHGCRLSVVSCQWNCRAKPPLLTTDNRQLTTDNSRRGFTLIELMITMGIIAVLAAMAALAVGGAMDAANIAKTRSLIARLNALVMPRYESYRYRRLPIAMPSGLTPQQAAQVRCDTLRQLMRMEMPDRWSDIYDPPANIGAAYLTTPIVMPRPAISQAYLAYYTAHPPVNPTSFAQAKCLYLLVTMGAEDNDVMENFNQGDIKAPDTDGLNCFVDAWGYPIMFLRWAPGFISQPVVPSSRTTFMPPFAAVSQLQTGWDPDQTDPTGVYGKPAAQGTAPTNANTYALYPLIYSAGPDGFYDIITDNQTSPIHYSQPTSGPPNNPFYSVISPTNTGSIGTPYPDLPVNQYLSHYDNVHNQLLGTR